jgi:hypothetical protein
VELALGAGIGAAAHVRSLAILLVPAIGLARICARAGAGAAGERWPRFLLERVILLAAAAFLVGLPWRMAQTRDAPAPPADQTLNYSISTAMWHTDPGDPRSPRVTPGRILARIPERLHEAALAVGSRLQHRIPGSAPPAPVARAVYLATALLFAAAWLVVLLRRRAATEWFVGGVGGVIALYFVFTDRLALPLFVFGLAASVEVLKEGVTRLAGPRAATIVPCSALALLIAVDFRPRADWPEIEARHRSFLETAAAVERALAPDARLGAAQGFHHSVYLGRPVHSLMYAVERSDRPEAAEEMIDKYHLNTVVLSSLVPADVVLVPYFRRRYGPGTPAGAAEIWRVRGVRPA